MSNGYLKHRAKIARRRGFTIVLPMRTEPDADARAKSGERYGHQLERRALHLFSVRPSAEWAAALPAWWRGLRAATFVEDMNGVDLWADTDSGPIAVQVKASAARAISFRERHPDMEVAVVVLHLDMPDEVLRDRLVERVAQVWASRAMRRAA